MPFSLETCSPKELADYLQTHRFTGENNSVYSTSQFLLESIATLPSSAAAGSSDPSRLQLLPLQTESDLGDCLVTASVSAMTPRAKFQLSVYSNHSTGAPTTLVLQDAKQQRIQITTNSVQHALVFPKPMDCIRTTAKGGRVSDMVLLVFDDNTTTATATTTYRGKPIRQVCFQLPETAPSPNHNHNSDDLTDIWMNLLTPIVGTHIIRIYHPYSPSQQHRNNAFVSFSDPSTSSTTAAMPFVHAVLGVQTGAIFPLEQGLLFLGTSAPHFVPSVNMTRIVVSGPVGNSARYISLQVELTANNTANTNKKPTSLEFTTIHRDEQAGLQRYVHETLIPAMKRQLLTEDDDNGTESSTTPTNQQQHQETTAVEQDGESEEESSDGEDYVEAEDETSTGSEEEEEDDDEEEETEDDMTPDRKKQRSK